MTTRFPGQTTAVDVPALWEIFPTAALTRAPLAVPIGEVFEVVVVPERHAQAAVELLAHHRPHPVGAIIADDDQWQFILPPGSGEPSWPSMAEHRAEGEMFVPPVFAKTAGSLRWARRGNESDRPFSAPLLLHTVLSLLAKPDCRGSDRVPASRTTAFIPASRTPVRI